MIPIFVRHYEKCAMFSVIPAEAGIQT